MINIIFSIFAIAILIGLAVGLLRIVSDKFFSYYGGILGTIIAYAINTFEFCFLAWLAAWVIGKLHLGFFPLGGIDWKLGLLLGPLYATYCWVKGEENKGITILRNDW